jgi:DNA-binding transcriptional MerR regulator
MASYGIGEVERILGLPATTLRHWEKVVPLLAPRKDAFGRRVYTEADLRVLFRLRHLAQDRGLGIGEAGKVILEESAARDGELGARLAEVRGELIGLYFLSLECARGLERWPWHEALK